MQQARIELLQTMPIFGGINEDSLHFLTDRATMVERDKGEYFFREDDEARSMFVLEAGKVAVSKQWQGDEHLLEHLSQGDCFGEMALIDLYPRSASVMAVEPCRAIELGYSAMLDLHLHSPEQFTLIQMNLARELSRRLRLADEQLFESQLDKTTH